MRIITFAIMSQSAPQVLIITYYWPPSSGSGVQRWMYFAKYLSDFGIRPIVLTVDPIKASYRKLDSSFVDFVKEVEAHTTKTLEPLKLYSLLTTGSTNKGIPQGSVGSEKKGLFSKISRYIRGNVFIPDARIGWKRYAVKKAKEILTREDIDLVITTGPPHSTHLIGRILKRKYGVRWMADFRDPWTEIYYARDLIQSKKSKIKDAKLEQSVINEADHILTIGPSMVDLLANKCAEPEKISYIYNGYDREKMESVPSQHSDEKMVISFVGLMTDAMPHGTFTAAMKRFMDTRVDAKITLRLAGDISSSFLSDIKNIIDVDQVDYVGYVSHREALRIMKSAHLLFTCLPSQEHSKIMISGKMLEYMATGNAILCIGDQESDAAGLLAKSDHSITVDEKDIEGCYQFIVDCHDRWVEDKSLRSTNDIAAFSRYETTRELAALIRTVSATTTP